MLNMHTLWVLADAEMRSCRRLARTWVFIVVAFLFCTGWYIDMVDSSMWPFPPGSLTDDQMTARYTIATMMNGFVAVFLIGIIFLSFDIRARDVQNRISDVVDSLPASNTEIIFGRLAGILLLVLIPCLIFLALVTGWETISGLVGTRFRLGIQPMSVLSLIAWNLIPNLVFFSTLVACLAALVRFRLLVAIIALGVLFGLIWIDNHIPVRFQESMSQFLSGALVPSDLAPVFATSAIIGNKCAILFVSIALLFFAASVLPRTDRRQTVTTTLGVTASGFAIVIFIGLVAAVQGSENLKDEWVNEHRQQNPESYPDIQHLEGTIDIYPGRKITLNVTLTVHKPTNNTTGFVIFSLNPGYEIQQLYIDDEETSNFSFAAGLLKVPTDLLPELSHEIRVEAEGKPDDRFAYLDQARDFEKLPDRGVRQLGLKNSIFHSDFVAMMPGIVWYPISGVVSERDKLELYQRDLFTSELTVSVPTRWQVATVGKRIIIDENQQRSTFQFTNGAPVPNLALMASNFDQRATMIEGIEFEVLFNKQHLDNLDTLTPFFNDVHQWIAERIKNARASSLDYPYEVFYVVEVPSNLRIYGGGWRMDTVLQPPGMMLIRESSFPTERFENVINRERSYEWNSEDEQDDRVFAELLRYFGNDMQGGSPFAGFARNFVSHQVSASQRGATALQFLLDQLSNKLSMQTESISIIPVLNFYNYIPYHIPNLGIGRTPDNYRSNSATRTRVRLASLPSTWEIMDRIALFDLDFVANSIFSNRILLVKGHALARSMIDYYGAEKIGVFLKQLIRDFRGQNFTLPEFLEVAAKIGLDFNDWVLPWLESTMLPGYLTDIPTVSVLATQEDDITNYQTSFVLSNNEPMPGLVRVFWTEKHEDQHRSRWPGGEFSHSDPLFLKGHQSKRIAIPSNHALAGIWIEPYLAHNRVPFEVLIPQHEEIIVQEIPILPFVSDIEWELQKAAGIVVDDLDPNFSIVQRVLDEEAFSFSESVFRSSTDEYEYDQRLRVSNAPLFGEWTRLNDSSSFGYYRRTSVPIARGDQTSAARFVAHLPHVGHWKLEIFVPKGAFDQIYYGSGIEFLGMTYDDTSFTTRNANPDAPEEHYRLVIMDGDAERTEKFDVANSQEGWNNVGIFDLDSTEVDVFLSDWAGHEEIIVYADAIRWSPIKADTQDNEKSP